MSSADGYQLNFAHDDFVSLDRFDSLMDAARRDEVVRDFLEMFAGSLLVTAPEWDIPHFFMTINVVRGPDGWEPRFVDEPLGYAPEGVVRAVERSGAKNRVTVRHFPGGDVRWVTSGEVSLEAAMRNEPGWIHTGEIVG